MRAGQAQMPAPPGAASGDEEERAGSLRLFHGCIAAIVLGAFVTVVLPLLVWAAAIFFAGAR
jgi:hypothetical protein